MEHGFGIDVPHAAKVIIFLIVLAYFILITGFGTYFSRFSKNINDFFFSGQRFAWWLAAASMIATGIGSYSYLKYSEQGFNTGMSSAMTYTNDWFIVPFFMFGWLPIIYFARVKSIPEYFERRFNRLARHIAVVIILCYMFFYIGYNLFTIGVAIQGMFGWPILYTVPVVALFLGAYVTFGGQTAVIFTDLFQGIMLYLAGGIAIVAGLVALGGFGDWWGYLPEAHRLPFVHLTSDPKFNTAGLFWGEALAGSIAFTFMNQGFIMRYLAIKSVNDGRKAALFNVLVTLPVSAVIVGAVGWLAKSLVVKQAVVGGALEGLNLIQIDNSFHTFVVVCWETLHQNAVVFGFVIAALTAALMSTIDTLINACAAIGIYDIYKPIFKPEADDRHYLKAARWASVGATVIGLLLVIWFHVQTLQGGNKVVLAGAGDSVRVTGLAEGQSYHVAVFAIEGAGVGVQYHRQPDLTLSFTTADAADASAAPVAAPGLTIASGSTDAVLTLAEAAPEGSLVIMKEGRPANWRPASGREYAANSDFKKAKSLGGGSLMSLHYKGIMVIIPSIVTTIFLGAFWRRFTAPAACVSMIVGMVVTVITNWYPHIIDPLSAFVAGPHNDKYIYMRALFGMSLTAVIGIVVSLFTQPRRDEEIAGLTIDTLDAGMALYKGGEPHHEVGEKVRHLPVEIDDALPAMQIALSPAVMRRLAAQEGDMVYVEDSRWYLGGLRSEHVKAAPPHQRAGDVVVMSRETFDSAYLLDGNPVTLEKIF